MKMGKGMWKFFKGRNLTRWLTSSSPYVLPTFKTLLHPLSTRLVLEASWISYFSSSWIVLMIISKIVVSLDKWLGKRCFCLKWRSMASKWCWFGEVHATWRWFAKLLVDVWSCQACSTMDHHGMSYLQTNVL
jgi:hypothetical protein